ncbi:MAG: DUF1318 domain-containing protein [Novosphingobium sp.]|nr:DUF1318 domain-containing protein [Novosphingobium sp.]MBX9642867.1 YdbL family protein [Novosphingobium sp.]
MTGLIERKHNWRSLVLAGAMLSLVLPAAQASAQVASPVLAAARASGEVGEKTDGYLGFPGTPSAEVRRAADELNIKRRAYYAERAAAQNTTVEAYALTMGCQLIAKTKPGEKYQAPDGSWRTRSAEPPLRSNLCPA